MSYRYLKVILSIFFIYVIPPALFGQLHDQLNWEELPPIPNAKGLAGMFVGVSDGSLISIGGANFPGKMPWEGGTKVWHDEIFILEDADSSWNIADKKLPIPLAYGVSISYKNKIIIVGGSNDQGHYSDVYTLTYSQGKIKIDTLSSLPYPLANMCGALVGDVLFIAGGSTRSTGSPGKYFLAFDLLKKKWIELNPWPGPARIQAVSAALENHFFLFSGINKKENEDGDTKRIILKDGYQFEPFYKGNNIYGGEWKSLSEMPRGVAAGPSPAPTFGSELIVFPGGLDDTTAKHEDPATFPGFATSLYAYNVESDNWINYGNLPEQSTRVTVPTVKWNKKWVIPSGEIAPGRRSPKVFMLSR